MRQLVRRTYQIRLTRHADPPTFSFTPSHLTSSRAKKLKCIKGGENAPCESCTNAGVTCEFRDRDQYFAERSAKSVNAAGNSSGSQRPQLSPRPRSTIPDYVSGPHNYRGSGPSRPQKSTNAHPSVQFCSPRGLNLSFTCEPGTPHPSRLTVRYLRTVRGPPLQTTPRHHCLTPTNGRDRIRC